MEENIITNPVQRTIWAYKPGWESLGSPWVRWEVVGMSRRIRSGGKSTRDPRTGRLLLRENAFHSDVWHEEHGLSNVETAFLTGQSGWRNVILPEGGAIKDRAIFAWYKAVGDVRMNLAVSMAERAKTADMLGLAAMRLGGALRALKRGFLWEAFRELARGQQVVRNLAVKNGVSKKLGRHFVHAPPEIKRGVSYANPENLWMEYSYGWVPFYNDVYGAMISAVDNFTTPAKRVRRSARDSTAFTNESTRDQEWYTQTRGHCRVTATVVGEVSMLNDLHHRMNSLGLVNPALLAWDLLPYSFVVDWFLPVNNWLEAQTSLVGLEIENVSVTTTARWTYVQETFPNSHEFLSGTTPHKGSGARTLKIRTLGVPDVPSLRLRMPGNFSNALTSLAILRQLGLGKGQPKPDLHSPYFR